MSVLNTDQYLQYKQSLCCLTQFKTSLVFNCVFKDQFCKIYRPEKSRIVQKGQIELSINNKTKRPQI